MIKNKKADELLCQRLDTHTGCPICMSSMNQESLTGIYLLKTLSLNIAIGGTKPLKHMGPCVTPKTHPNHNIKEVMRQHI